MKKDKTTIKIRENYLAFIGLAFIIALFYGNTLFNGFVLDDFQQIIENQHVKSFRYLPELLTNCVLGSDREGCQHVVYYRPIHNLSSLLTYQLSSQPWFFHLINLIYFLTVASLVFVFVKHLTKSFLTAFLTAFFFIIHPVNNEVVNWVATIPELALTIFAVLASISYIKYRQKGSSRDFSMVYVFYFLAILSKETGVFIIPLIVFALDFFFFKMPARDLLSSKERGKYLLFAVPLIPYFIIRALTFGNIIGPAGVKSSFSGTLFAERIYAFFHLFALYLKELLYPYPLIFFHEFSASPQLLNPALLFAFLAMFAFAYLIYFSFKKTQRIISFALSWIFIFSLPNIIFLNLSGKNVFFSRYLLGSSIGFALLVAYCLNYLWSTKQLLICEKAGNAQFFKHLIPPLALIQPQKKRRIFVFLFIAVSFIVSFLIIFPRNKVWKDNPTLIRTDVALNPDADYTIFLRDHLADFLRRRGDVDGAINLYQEILKQKIPDFYISPFYTNIATSYQLKGDSSRAEEYYLKAAGAAVRGSYGVFNNLGAFYLEREEYLKALLNFCRAMMINPQAQETSLNINRLATFLSEAKTDKLPLFYQDIVAGFQKDTTENIQYKKRDCSDKNCSYIFTASFSSGEIVLPFLIMGYHKSGEVFKPEDLSFDQEKSEIYLVAPIEYKDKTTAFIFPTCNGIYYEVAVNTKQ